jgi:hypothetical protein
MRVDRQFTLRRIAMAKDQVLRKHILELLSGGHAHLTFQEATANMPAELQGVKPASLPYSPWQLLEHMRLAQWDILQFSIDPKHVSPDFPNGYWPSGQAPPNSEAWGHSITMFQADLKAMMDLVAEPKTDLFTPIAHGQGQTILREALLIADHNAYHLGQLITVRRLLGTWHDN